MTNIVPALIIILALAGCAGPESTVAETAAVEPTLEVVAESERQWTGVAVTSDGRIFVNFPRWWPEVPVSLAEVLADGSLAPYPNQAWNAWTPDTDPRTSLTASPRSSMSTTTNEPLAEMKARNCSTLRRTTADRRGRRSTWPSV